MTYEPQHVRVVHVHHYRTRYIRDAWRFTTGLVPFYGFFRSLFLCLIIIWGYVSFFHDGDDIPLIPGVSCATKQPVGGMQGVAYAAGETVREFRADPPSVRQVQDSLMNVFRGAGEMLGTFEAALHGAKPPMEPTQRRGEILEAAGCVPCPDGSIRPTDVGGHGAMLAARAAKAVGFRGHSLVTAVAVAGAESGWRPLAKNTGNSDGSVDHGLWQINSVHRELLARYDWRDPTDNATMAFKISAHGVDWSAWVAWSNGLHTSYLDEARAAVAKLRGNGTVVTAAGWGGGPCDESAVPANVTTVRGRAWPTPKGFHTSTYSGHDGVDINGSATDGWADHGDPIVAVSSGIIDYAGWGQGYGKGIFIRTDDGHLNVYGHCSKIVVRQGQRVTAGQLIGRVGNTGNSTAPHLHFAVDPGSTYAAAMRYLPPPPRSS